MEDEDGDAATLFQRLIDDLLIYEPGSLLEKAPLRPSREDLADLETETALRVLKVLRRYVRPRNEVLRIRRAVNTAFEQDQIDSENIYSRHSELKRELEQLKNEKEELAGKLRSIKGKRTNGNDAQNILVGNMILQKSQKQVQILRIYREHLKLLLGNSEQVDNQTTLSRTEALATLLTPSYSARRDSAVLSESDLQLKQTELLQSLQTSKPKQILQSLAFLTSHSTQSLTKVYSPTTPRSKRSTAEKIEAENSLFPLKQSLIANSEKLISLQNTIANIPKKEYATTEAKCRALRAARTEALDRLDEIVSSSSEIEQVNDDWNDDVNAAKELIEQRISRIKSLIKRYYDLRAETQTLQEIAKKSAKEFIENPQISTIPSIEISKTSEWTTFLTNQQLPPSLEEITLSQLESALYTKWKIESAQILHESMRSKVTSALNIMKNETLYNLSVESPLLRDADILDSQSISATWRDASLQKGKALKEWVTQRVEEGEALLNSAENKLRVIRCFEKEGQALKTLGENVL